MTVRTGNAEIGVRIRRHPDVGIVEPGEPESLEFDDRRLQIGTGPIGIAGLIELMDNNPLVCTNLATAPDPASTLALIALGPVFQAGIVTESPNFSTNAPGEHIEAFLTTVGWSGGVTLDQHPEETDVYAAVAMAVIQTPDDLGEIDEIYEERYGRTFFIRRDEASDWSPDLVRDRPYALYRLRITPDEPTSLLTIHVIAARDGKCGADQAIHMFNVMSGFEESLGIA